MLCGVHNYNETCETPSYFEEAAACKINVTPLQSGVICAEFDKPIRHNKRPGNVKPRAVPRLLRLHCAQPRTERSPSRGRTRETGLMFEESHIRPMCPVILQLTANRIWSLTGSRQPENAQCDTQLEPLPLSTIDKVYTRDVAKSLSKSMY